MTWTLYLLECHRGHPVDGARKGKSPTCLYAGITNDLEARFAAHAAGKGAKFTRANPPIAIVATRAYPDRSTASRAEWALKQRPRDRKIAFMHHHVDDEQNSPDDPDAPSATSDRPRC